ncbi:MAG TPA: epoxide hydrolase N-terminal domain-containing protein, partial [Candidatus Baltobacteraceae bacterium]|nr:epoxide hydrolase N-terminal domain-containing protein [Candidatus Baltobacteraceae bacterium]
MRKNIDRRAFLNTAAIGVAAAELGTLRLAGAQTPSGTPGDTVRPFQVNVPQATLTDMRRRINATIWPERETVDDTSQGVPLAMMQGLASYWATEYDWR